MPAVRAKMFVCISVLVVAACTTPTRKLDQPPNDAGTDGTPGPAGCLKHEDCASRVCLLNGSCADAETVAYVDPTGTDNAACTQAMPCVSLQKALATPQRTVKMVGTTKENVKISEDVTVFGGPGAKLTSATAGSVIEITGNPQVSIFDLEVTGATGPVGHGIYVQPGKATVGLERVIVSKNARAGLYVGTGNTATVSQSTLDANGPGIYVNGGTLRVNHTTISASTSAGLSVEDRGVATVMDSTLRDSEDWGGGAFTGGTLNIVRSTVKDNRDEGLFAYGSSLSVQQSTIQGNGQVSGSSGISALSKTAVTVLQSTIVGNASGGISVYNPTEFHIVNNFIVRNGGSSSFLGGVSIHRDPDRLSTTGEFRFNTIADNKASSTSTAAGSIDCEGGFAAPGNLIIRNTGGEGNPPTRGDCDFTGSLVNPPEDPAFKSATDYHLTAATPQAFINKAPCAGNERDVDDEARPGGNACDIGADERP